MVPGFVVAGAVAVASQLLVVAGFYGYVRYRNPLPPRRPRRRALAVLAAGAALAGAGQLAALGAVGSLQVAPLLSFEQALVVQDAGLAGAAVGYLGVLAGLVLHGRASRRAA